MLELELGITIVRILVVLSLSFIGIAIRKIIKEQK